MSVITTKTILNRMKEPDVAKRLVVTPVLDVAEQLKEDQAAIDLRLGRAFSLVRPWSHGVAELVSAEPTPLPPLQHIVLDFGQPLIIHPHQFVLARTLEFVRLPKDLTAHVIGRSSWGRRGLIVATAVIVHPGFAGPITLELKNVGEVPLALYAMDRVAQLSLFSADGIIPTAPPSKRGHASQFASSYSPGLGDVRDPATEDRITKLAKEGQ